MKFGKNLVLNSQLILTLSEMSRDQFFKQLSKFSENQQEKEANDFLWARCATDVELFANVFFPHYCQHPFNKLHHDVFSSTHFMERAIRRARGAPRGYAKSTLEAFILPIHDACYGLEAFILLISNTQGQADQKLADIRTEILTNAALIDFYGVHFKVSRPGAQRYTIYTAHSATLFASYGAGAEIRGVRFGAHRPSKIVADDMEHSEEVNNEDLRRKYEDWFFQVISKVGNKLTNIHVIGTILHPESLLMGLTKNAGYDSKIYKAVVSWSSRQDLWNEWTRIYTDLDDPERRPRADAFYESNKDQLLAGVEVLWPEHESYLDLMKELIETGRRAFMKEKQNEPLGAEESLFETMHWYHEVTDGLFIEKPGHKDGGVLIPWSELKDSKGRWLNAYGALDPATGQTKSKAGKAGDYSAIVVGIKDLKADRLLVHEDWTKRAAPTKFIQAVFDLDDKYDFQKFGVETNLFRDLLIPNMNDERRRRETELKKTIKVPFYDIVNVDNKEKRIFTLEPKTTHGKLVFNRALSETFKRQFELFPKGDFDDAVDATHMLWELVNNRYKATPMPGSGLGGR